MEMGVRAFFAEAETTTLPAMQDAREAAHAASAAGHFRQRAGACVSSTATVATRLRSCRISQS